jgi:hypothetical protein
MYFDERNISTAETTKPPTPYSLYASKKETPNGLGLNLIAVDLPQGMQVLR